MQGGALDVLESFFSALATAPGAPPGQGDALLAALMEAGKGAAGAGAGAGVAPRQAQHSVARCVAALATVSPAKVPPTVELLLQSVNAKDPGVCVCVGVRGRTVGGWDGWGAAVMVAANGSAGLEASCLVCVASRLRQAARVWVAEHVCKGFPLSCYHAIHPAHLAINTQAPSAWRCCAWGRSAAAPTCRGCRRWRRR